MQGLHIVLYVFAHALPPSQFPQETYVYVHTTLYCENTPIPLPAGLLSSCAHRKTQGHMCLHMHCSSSPPAPQEAAPQRRDRYWWSASGSLGLLFPCCPHRLLMGLIEQQHGLSRQALVLVSFSTPSCPGVPWCLSFRIYNRECST